MKILFIGDIVGSIGRDALKDNLQRIKEKYAPHFIIVNGENAASGKGITEKIYKDFLTLGVNAVTMGNHVWDNKDIFEFIEDAKGLVRPANYPDGTPGAGLKFFKWNTQEIAVINVLGRTFMNPVDDPFSVTEKLVAEARKRTPIIFVDFHAEATSEKQAFGWFLDGSVSAVVGTHTHIQTSDNRVLPEGTAYMTDVGMTGAYDGILGVEKEAILYRFQTLLPKRHEVPKSGRAVLSGVVVDVDDKTGRARSIERILINDDNLFK